MFCKPGSILALSCADMPARSSFLGLFLRNPTGVVGVSILVLVIAAALLAPWLYPGDPLDMVTRPFLWPFSNPAFPLGSDSLGRDVLAGVVHGARVSVLIGVSATTIGVVIGTLVGATAGYFGGKADDALVRLMEVFQTFPPFLLIIVLVSIFEPSVLTITLAIGIVSWPTIGRLVRAEFRTLRERDFVVAAQGLGYGSLRIAFREVLPNAMTPVIVTTSVMVATAILNESALSFLGLGDPNLVSWGSMIGAGRDQLRTAWFLVTLPGCALVLSVLSLNLVGDGLNDALNPRARGR
jgi:peptide/nickel transport system permease protein